MGDDYYIAAGTVQSNLEIYVFSQLLSRAGLPAEVRESVHSAGGEYVSLRQGEALIKAEKIEACSYLLRGEGSEGPELDALCKSLSSILSAARIEHRIELYDEADNLCHEHIYPSVA